MLVALNAIYTLMAPKCVIPSPVLSSKPRTQILYFFLSSFMKASHRPLKLSVPKLNHDASLSPPPHPQSSPLC